MGGVWGGGGSGRVGLGHPETPGETGEEEGAVGASPFSTQPLSHAPPLRLRPGGFGQGSGGKERRAGREGQPTQAEPLPLAAAEHAAAALLLQSSRH